MAIEEKAYHVETFEMSVSNEPIEIAEEAEKLIAELDLEGQRGLLQTTKEGVTVRCPFREMNKDEEWVYGLLLPEKTAVEAYDDPMPVEVLRTLKRAKEFFPRFVVWHKPKGNPDPILVGYDDENQWSGKAHILIRWGSILEEWPRLVADAVRAYKAEVIEACHDLIEKTKARLVTVEALSEEALPKERGVPSSFHL